VDLGLAGKTVIVTGGNGGIGRGITLAFAREGANVVIAARDVEKAAEVCGDAAGFDAEMLCVATDVTARASVDEMLRTALERFGTVDALVNNAGGVCRPGPFLDQTAEDAEWEIALNIRGVYNCTQAIGRHMAARGQGSIVNISSNSSLLGEAAHYCANYGAAKGYVNSLTKALAYEWAGIGIRVNNIAPGWIVPWEEGQVSANSFWQRFGFEMFGTPEEMKRQAEAGTLFNIGNQPIRRVGRPEDIANLCLFFASDVSSFITGYTVSVSGGVYMP
jgi:NAD(P)-dependent dehydrogenase (short-subunit alcohol dehydrogenase family)